MNIKLERVEVDIFGENYAIKGTDSPEYIKMVAHYVDKKMKMIAGRNPRLSAAKVAVLTAVNLADELRKLQEDYENLVKLIEEDKNHVKV